MIKREKKSYTFELMINIVKKKIGRDIENIGNTNLILLKKKNILGELCKLLKIFEGNGKFYLFGSALYNLKSANDLDLIFIPSRDIKIPKWSKKVYIQYNEYRRGDNKPKENYIDLIVDSSGIFHKRISRKIGLEEWVTNGIL